jgi:hypothetical protein
MTKDEQRAMDEKFWTTNRRMAEQLPDEARQFGEIYQSLTLVQEQLATMLMSMAETSLATGRYIESWVHSRKDG